MAERVVEAGERAAVAFSTGTGDKENASRRIGAPSRVEGRLMLSSLNVGTWRWCEHHETRILCSHTPEAIPPNRFTSSNPLTRSSGGSLSSSGPRIGVSGEAGSRETFPASAIKSARRCLGPVNGIGFSRKVADTVRQSRGSSKYIRTKAVINSRLCRKGKRVSGPTYRRLLRA